MGNRYRGATRNTLEVVPGLDGTRSPGAYSGFKTALTKIGEKIMDPPSTTNSVGKRRRSKTTRKNGGNSGTKLSNYNTSGRLPS